MYLGSFLDLVDDLAEDAKELIDAVDGIDGTDGTGVIDKTDCLETIG